jgi:hypothetical protein
VAAYPRILELVPEEEDFMGPEPSGRFDFSATDRRAFQRAILDAELEIRVFDAEQRELCRGRALLHDLSLDGALLTAIRIEQTSDGAAPEQLGAFASIGFTVVNGPFRGAEAKALPVRLDGRLAGLGVKLCDGFQFAA